MFIVYQKQKIYMNRPQNKKPKFNTDCWIWPYSTNKDGYGHFQKDGVMKDVYRWMYEQIKGPVPHGCELDHLCRNRLCVNPEHLEPVSHAVNSRRGNRAKFTNEQVLEIRALQGKMTQKEIGKKYGVSGSCIGYIHKGRNYV